MATITEIEMLKSRLDEEGLAIIAARIPDLMMQSAEVTIEMIEKDIDSFRRRKPLKRNSLKPLNENTGCTSDGAFWRQED